MRHIFMAIFGSKSVHIKILLCNSGFFYIYRENHGIINIFNVTLV